MDGREPRSALSSFAFSPGTTDPAVSSPGADRFRAKSRLPLIQRRLTGHSSRTAHYRYYQAPSSIEIIIIVVCFCTAKSRALSHPHGRVGVPHHPVAFSKRGRDPGWPAISHEIYYRWPIPTLSAPSSATFVSNWNRTSTGRRRRFLGLGVGTRDRTRGQSLGPGAINMSGKLIETLDAFRVLRYRAVVFQRFGEWKKVERIVCRC